MKHRKKTGISKSPHLKPNKEKSAAVNVPAGTDGRPMKAKFPIETSAPKHPHKLSRAPAGALK